jgi:hypothetical protein
MTSLRRWALEKYALGEMSAKDLCVLAWHTRAHADLGLGDLVMDPDSSTGNFEKHVTARLDLQNFASRDVFWSPVPLHIKRQGRVLQDHPFLLPHERASAFAAWCKEGAVAASSPTMLQAPHLADNPTLLQHGPSGCILLHAFTDGVSYTGTTSSVPDSLWVFTWAPMQFSIDPRQRRVITVLQKSRACKCGCRGRCSFNAICEVIAWSGEALAAGAHPLQGPCGMPLTGWRQHVAGRPLSLPGAFAQLSADLMAYGEVCGFRSMSSKRHPCWMCACHGPDMHAYSTPQRARVAAEWESNVVATKLVAHLPAATAVGLQGLLRADKKRKGGHGRCLAADITVDDVSGHPIVLRRRDRLQVGGSVNDAWKDLSALASPQVELHFFREAESAFIMDWCPLRRVLRLTDCTPDMMHIVDLGVAQYITGEMLSHCVLTDALGTMRPTYDAAERLEAATRELDQRLVTWYSSAEGQHFTKAPGVSKNSCRHVLLWGQWYGRCLSCASQCKHRVFRR